MIISIHTSILIPSMGTATFRKIAETGAPITVTNHLKEELIDVFFAVLTDGIVFKLVSSVGMDKAKVGH